MAWVTRRRPDRPMCWRRSALATTSLFHPRDAARMAFDSSKSLPSLGFLAVLERPDQGLMGGFLVVSTRGRPLEFRCTTPVAPSRAQEILYGAALRPHLHSEVIGHPLLAGADLCPPLVLVNDRDFLGLALMTETCIAEVHPIENGTVAAETPAAAESEEPSARRSEFALGGCRITLADTCRLDDASRQSLDELSRHVPLIEPFERIRTALDEVLAASATDERSDDFSPFAA